MSETAIFIIGAVIFAITVYGTVMAGGVALTRMEIEQNPNLEENLEEHGEESGKKGRFRFGMNY